MKMLSIHVVPVCDVHIKNVVRIILNSGILAAKIKKIVLAKSIHFA